MNFNPSIYRVIFFGTPEFSVPILEILIKEKYNIVAVVTQPDKPKGRNKKLLPTPIKIFAEHKKLQLFQPKIIRNNEEFIQEIINLKPDFFVVAAYGKILPKKFLEIPKYGSLNVHASLLPKYRGPSPIQTALLNGDKETGVSIMLLDQGMDTGDIIAARSIKIDHEDTSETLHNKLSNLGAKVMAKIIPKYINKQLLPVKQDEDKASYSIIITKEHGRINWDEAAETIFNKLRAYSPWPGIFTFWNNKRIKIIKAKVYNKQRQSSAKTGTVTIEDGHIYVLCGSNTRLEILQLQIEGKKPVLAKNFIKGYNIANQALK